MGYSIYIASKTKKIQTTDYQSALKQLNTFYRGEFGIPTCNVELDNNGRYICISGSFSMSGKYAEGFTLNLVNALIKLGYSPTIISHDFDYRDQEDLDWLDGKN